MSVIIFCGLAAGADTIWDGGAGSGLWSIGANWVGDAVPPAGNRVIIEPSNAADVVFDVVSYAANKMIMGSPAATVPGTTLTFTTGTFTNPSYFIVGNGSGKIGTVYIDGADAAVTARDFNLGSVGGTGYAYVSAGTLTVTGAGTNVGLCVPFDASSSGRLNISGAGKVVAAQLTMYANGVIDISEGGQLRLNGDKRSLVDDYVTACRITGYGGAGRIKVDYDTVNPGMTTVYSVASIQGMIDAAAVGDTIYIPDGVYNEGQFNIDKPITLVSMNGCENTVINLTGNGLGIIADNVTINGFTIQNQDGGIVYLVRIGKSVAGVAYNVSGCRIENCVIRSENRTDGISVCSNSTNIDLLSNKVFNCVNGLVVYPNSTDIAIIDNDIYRNSCGVRLLGSAGNVRIMANGIYWNSLYGLFNHTTTATDAKNNFWGLQTGPYHQVMNSYGKGNGVSDYVDFMPYFVGNVTPRWSLCPQADLSGDCKVDIADFVLMAESWCGDI